MSLQVLRRATRRTPPRALSLERLGPLVVVASVTLFAAGCATPPHAGPSAETTPPRLIQDEDGTVIWDNPYAFQPVPRALLDAGNRACRDAGMALPAGYHPYARDLNGQQITGGGYFCVAQAVFWPLRSSTQDQATATQSPSTVP